jgi:hypothetical protein
MGLMSARVDWEMCLVWGWRGDRGERVWNGRFLMGEC